MYILNAHYIKYVYFTLCILNTHNSTVVTEVTIKGCLLLPITIGPGVNTFVFGDMNGCKRETVAP